MRLIAILPLLAFTVGCPGDAPNNATIPREATYYATPDGHLWAIEAIPENYSESQISSAIDRHYKAFKTLFPEFNVWVNTVYVRPEAEFAVDGKWVFGFYVFGDSHVTVSLTSGTLMTPCSFVPHELLHTCIGDPLHTSPLWDRLSSTSLGPTEFP